MVAYNISQLGDAEGFVGITQQLNIASSGLLGILILIAVFIVFFIAFKNFETKIAFLTTSLITSFIGVLEFSIEIIPYQVLLFPIGGVFASLIWMALGDD
jgi:hypothetical protein